MSDLISREAAIDALHTLSMYYGPYAEEALKEGVKKLKRLPHMDAEPVRHGRWSGNSLDFSCSVCGVYQNIYTGRTNYGPNCGAKMDEEV